jgi:hypothetical protein
MTQEVQRFGKFVTTEGNRGLSGSLFASLAYSWCNNTLLTLFLITKNLLKRTNTSQREDSFLGTLQSLIPQEICAFHGTWRFNTMFTTAQTEPRNSFTPLYPGWSPLIRRTLWNTLYNPPVHSPGLFHSGYNKQNARYFLVFTAHATCHIHLKLSA